MEDDLYFVVYLNEDGDGSINAYTREQILNMVNDDHWAGVSPLTLRPGVGIGVGEESGILILKGKQVFPKAKKVIETWDID